MNMDFIVKYNYGNMFTWAYETNYKWGNCLRIRLPKSLLYKVYIKEGDTIEIAFAPISW